MAKRMKGQNSGSLRETSKRVTRNAPSWIVSTQKWDFPDVITCTISLSSCAISSPKLRLT